MKLNPLRNKITQTDKEIINLLFRRISLSRKIAVQKRKNNIIIKNGKREKEVSEFWTEQAIRHNLNAKFILSLLKLILKESRRVQHAENNQV